MTGGQRVALQILRRFQKVAELDRLVTQHAGHRRLATHVGIGKRIDHVFAEPGFVV